MVQKKCCKKNVTDDDPYLEPILLTGSIKKRILHLINKVTDTKIQVDNVYLQNKLTDPGLHPNDYMRFEEPSDFTFEYVLATCKEVYLLKNMTAPLQMDSQSLEAAHQEMVEEAAGSRSEEMQNELDDITKEFNLPTIPKGVPILNETFEMGSSEEDISGMKIHEAFKLFKANCCGKLKDGICHKRHYLIGMGDVEIDKKTYSGLHIYLYPDPHFDQVDIPEENIKDALYLRFQAEKTNSNIQELREYYKQEYINEFSLFLARL